MLSMTALNLHKKYVTKGVNDLQFPTIEELETLRKGMRKKKQPRVFDAMWCSEPGIGGMKATATDSDFLVEWVTFNDGVKSELKQAMWSVLCLDPDFESKRLEVGYVVAAIMRMQGQKVAEAVGHPLEGMKEAKPYMQASDEWQHWGMVRAGHMLGL
jgi:hypothetical protein